VKNDVLPRGKCNFLVVSCGAEEEFVDEFLAFRDWLGGLDSNQDNQIQSLMYCQLYDLPAGGKQ
jgi:hypothetical protein